MKAGNVADAAWKEDWEKVRELVRQRHDVNVVGGRWRGTILHYAAFWGHKAICELVLRRGGNISARDRDGDQPLHVAARANEADICKLFVDHGADVSAVNNDGKTPLLKAVADGKDSPGLCRPLITNDSVNVADRDGNHALHIAARKGYIPSVQLLVDCGADVEAVNKHGQTPLHTAAGGEKDCPELCEILLKHDAKIDAVDEDGNQPLHLARKRGHTETVKLLLARGADVKAVDADGNQCLHLSCEAGQTSTVQALLDCNADVLATNNCMQTSLHKVASSARDYPDICMMLIAKGAQVNAADGNGDTSLQVAFQKGNMKTAQALLANGGESKVLNGCGETVLHAVCKGGVECHELCEDLISRGVSPHTADREGNLPFHVALKNRLPKTFCFLFEQWGGSTLDDLQKVNISDIDIGHLLCVAAWKHDNATCGKLLSFGASTCVTDADRPGWRSVPKGTGGHQALHHAVRVGDAQLCQLLIDHGASVNAQIGREVYRSHHLNQPLQIAVNEGHLGICRLLIEKGACLESTMSRGRTALHLAIVGNKEAMVRLLLSHGADLSKVKIGNTPALERSEVTGNLKVAALVQASDKYPDEIVSQGEAALQIYLSSCSEGTVVTVFFRVDVVGRDRAGKTSLTKSLTLQKFDPDELSTRGVVFDPKCQIIVKEACDWTNPVTSQHYRDMYDKNVTAIVAEVLDTPEMKDQYFSSKEGDRPRRRSRRQKANSLFDKPSSAEIVAVSHDAKDPVTPMVEELDVTVMEGDSEISDRYFSFSSANTRGGHPAPCSQTSASADAQDDTSKCDMSDDTLPTMLGDDNCLFEPSPTQSLLPHSQTADLISSTLPSRNSIPQPVNFMTKSTPTSTTDPYPCEPTNSLAVHQQLEGETMTVGNLSEDEVTSAVSGISAGPGNGRQQRAVISQKGRKRTRKARARVASMQSEADHKQVRQRRSQDRKSKKKKRERVGSSPSPLSVTGLSGDLEMKTSHMTTLPENIQMFPGHSSTTERGMHSLAFQPGVSQMSSDPVYEPAYNYYSLSNEPHHGCMTGGSTTPSLSTDSVLSIPEIQANVFQSAVCPPNIRAGSIPVSGYPNIVSSPAVHSHLQVPFGISLSQTSQHHQSSWPPHDIPRLSSCFVASDCPGTQSSFPGVFTSDNSIPWTQANVTTFSRFPNTFGTLTGKEPSPTVSQRLLPESGPLFPSVSSSMTSTSLQSRDQQTTETRRGLHSSPTQRAVSRSVRQDPDHVLLPAKEQFSYGTAGHAVNAMDDILSRQNASEECKTFITMGSSSSSIPGPVSASVSLDSLLHSSQQCSLPCHESGVQSPSHQGLPLHSDSESRLLSFHGRYLESDMSTTTSHELAARLVSNVIDKPESYPKELDRSGETQLDAVSKRAEMSLSQLSLAVDSSLSAITFASCSMMSVSEDDLQVDTKSTTWPASEASLQMGIDNVPQCIDGPHQDIDSSYTSCPIVCTPDDTVTCSMPHTSHLDDSVSRYLTQPTFVQSDSFLLEGVTASPASLHSSVLNVSDNYLDTPRGHLEHATTENSELNSNTTTLTATALSTRRHDSSTASVVVSSMLPSTITSVSLPINSKTQSLSEPMRYPEADEGMNELLNVGDSSGEEVTVGVTGYRSSAASAVISQQGRKWARKARTALAKTEIPAGSRQLMQHASQGTESKGRKRARVESIFSPVSEKGLSGHIQTETSDTTTLPENIQKRVSGYLRDKESREKAKNEIVVTILDYAGQHVFYATHHLCLSKASFYYVVFDASLPLDAKALSLFCISKGEIVQISLSDEETNYDRVEEWMSAIHIMEPDHSCRIMLFDKEGITSPAMFLVGTHADKLKEQPGMLERQDEFMRKKLEGTVLSEHIIWASKDRMCFYVDNTLTDPDSGTVDPQVHLLREMTEKVARKVAQRHNLPIPWLKFEQEVRDVKEKDSTKKTASVQELLHLAMKTAGIKNKEELEVLLHYLSNRAVLLYHPEALKSGDEEVVLDVEWLIAKVEKVITVQMDVPLMLRGDVKRSREEGILTVSLIRYLLSETGSSHHLIVSLMNHFDLLCQYSGLSVEHLDQADDARDFINLENQMEDYLPTEIDSRECSAFFVPCLLHRVSTLRSLNTPDNCKTVPLLLCCFPLRIPRALFYRVLTRLCRRFCRLPILFRNVGYFHVYPGNKLEFSLNRYSFQMCVISETDTCPDGRVCSMVREYVVSTIEDAKKVGMAGLKLQLGYMQAVQVTGDSVNPEERFVSLVGFPHSRRLLYSSRTNEEVVVPHQLMKWFPGIQPTVLSSDCRLPASTSVTYSRLTAVKKLLDDATNLCMHELSIALDKEDLIGDDWRRLWSELIARPLSEREVREKEGGPTRFLLNLWCRMKPTEATIGQLSRALSAIYRNDVAEILENFCTKSSCDESRVEDLEKMIDPEINAEVAERHRGCGQPFTALDKTVGIRLGRLKILFMGAAMAGKTSLVKALVSGEPYLTQCEDRTIGVEETVIIVEGGRQFKLIDCGGHKAHMLTNQLMLSDNALAIVVVDVSEYEFTEESYRQNIGDFLEVLYERNSRAHVVIVMNKVDRIGISRGECSANCKLHLQTCLRHFLEIRESQIRRMSEIDVGRDSRQDDKFTEHLGFLRSQRITVEENVLLTSCATHEGVQSLWDLLRRLSEDTNLLPSLQTSLPSSWVSVEDKLVQLTSDCSVPIIDVSDAVALSVQHGLTREGCLSLLNYLYQVGSVLYFSRQVALSHVLFPSTAFVVDLLKPVFRHDHANLTYDYRFIGVGIAPQQFEQIKSDLVHNGIARISMLLALWSDFHLIADRHVDVIIRLFLAFDFAHLIASSDEATQRLSDTFRRRALAISTSTASQLLPSVADNVSTSSASARLMIAEPHSSDDSEASEHLICKLKQRNVGLLLPWLLSEQEPSDVHQVWPQDRQGGTMQVVVKYSFAYNCPLGLFDRLSARCHCHSGYVRHWRNGLLMCYGPVSLLFDCNNQPSSASICLQGRVTTSHYNAVRLWHILLRCVADLEDLLSSTPGVLVDRSIRDETPSRRSRSSMFSQVEYFIPTMNWPPFAIEAVAGRYSAEMSEHISAVTQVCPSLVGGTFLCRVLSPRSGTLVNHAELAGIARDVGHSWPKLAIIVGATMADVDQLSSDSKVPVFAALRILDDWFESRQKQLMVCELYDALCAAGLSLVAETRLYDLMAPDAASGLQERTEETRPPLQISEFDGVPTHVIGVVADIGKNRWREMGRALGATDEELDDYDRHCKSAKDKLFHIVYDCIRKCEGVTVHQFLEACDRVGIGGSVRDRLETKPATY